MTESDLQINVIKLLSAYGRSDICWWHVPNGEHRAKTVGARLKQMGVRRGVSDIHLVIDGQFHAVELKTMDGKLSADQATYREDIERAGGFFHVARGIDQAIGVLKGLNAFRTVITISPVSQEPSRRHGSPRKSAATGATRPWQFPSET